MVEQSTQLWPTVLAHDAKMIVATANREIADQLQPSWKRREVVRASKKDIVQKGKGRTGVEPVTSGMRFIGELQSYTLPLSYRPLSCFDD